MAGAKFSYQPPLEKRSDVSACAAVGAAASAARTKAKMRFMKAIRVLKEWAYSVSELRAPQPHRTNASRAPRTTMSVLTPRPDLFPFIPDLFFLASQKSHRVRFRRHASFLSERPGKRPPLGENIMKLLCACAAMALASFSFAGAANAADYPAPKQGDIIAKNFKIHTGETMPELKLHYATVGDPSGQPVLVLHGSGGSTRTMLTPTFAGELFGPGQPLDATKYFIIIPDGIGHGKSSKPSDGM